MVTLQATNIPEKMGGVVLLITLGHKKRVQRDGWFKALNPLLLGLFFNVFLC